MSIYRLSPKSSRNLATKSSCQWPISFMRTKMNLRTFGNRHSSLLCNFVSDQLESTMKNIISLLLTAIGVLNLNSAIIIDGRLDNSRIFPGTVHTYKISIPEEYNPEEGACLYVGLDGILCNAPNVIDTLIAEKAMPVTIGVYLNPGIVYSPDGSVLRYNRSYEFDSTTDLLAAFIEEELLPDVLKHITPDGQKIKFKTGGQNAAIFGLSSGGIAAFNVAWQRPDLFSRVFAGCGTFVPMRGGNQLEAIVRKHEPKPLRIFLQDGYSDTWNPIFGSWYEHNRMLASALEFAGYDCDFDWAEGGHSVARSSKIFKDVMRWMWRDYPQPIEKGETRNNFLHPLLDLKNSDWQQIKGNYRPVTVQDGVFNADTTLYVTREPGTDYLLQYTVDPVTKTLSNGERFYYLHSYDNVTLSKPSFTFDSLGNLWTLTEAGIQILDQNGRVRGILDLPANINKSCLENYQIILDDGVLNLITPDALYFRNLNVKPAVSGFTPPSQGQA